MVGTIEPGKWADLVVLDGDYMEVTEEQISDLKVVMTLVGGKVVFEAGGPGTETGPASFHR
ncbi:MAG: amidohydrolase family protein [Acidobacteria bacterium]|nr:amidohydrolase family protein [Acidobacteriota bacterium]